MSATVVLTRSAQFDPLADKYKCCCNWCMAQDGTILLAVLEILSIVVSFVVAGIDVATLNKSDQSSSNIDYDYAAFFIAGISVITLTLLYFGYKRTKPSLLIPHMARRACLIFFIFVIICMIMGARLSFPEFKVRSCTNQGSDMSICAKGDQESVSLSGRDVPAKILLGFVVILLESWMLWVNLKCYRFLKDKKEYLLVAQSDSPSFNYSNDQLLGTDSCKAVSV